MSSVISKLIIRTLCDNQGSLDFKRLDERISQSYTVAEQVLQGVLFDSGNVAVLEGKQDVGGKMLNPDSLIVAKTGLRLCQKKTGQCLRCDSLHLCRYHVCGGCTFGHRCKNSHNLASPYNAELLRKHDYHDLTEKQLFQLLLQNDPYLLPEICPHYNKGDGVYGSCKFTASCTKLHVCEHYLQGDCRFGSSCKRTHQFNAAGMKIFKGFSQEIMINLCEIYRNKLIIMKQQERPPTHAYVVPEMTLPTQQRSFCNTGLPMSSASSPKPPSDADGNEICLYFLRRYCSFKERCTRVHWHLPYRWQVLNNDGMTWNDLPNMNDIEETYCDPERDTSCMDGTQRLLSLMRSPTDIAPSVDFMTMTYGGSRVRRLSTVSSVSKPPNLTLTTEWRWYWEDDDGKWVEFGQGDCNPPATVNSQILENIYLTEKGTDTHFGAGNHQYILHFKDALGTQMYQQNVKYKTKRDVRRRPLFVSAQDVEGKLKSASSPSPSSFTAKGYPLYWDKNSLPEIGYKLVPLSKSAKDYTMIENLFKGTLPQHKINNIQRIQNPSLWQIFQWQKEQMTKRNTGKAVDQRYLFHGTDDSLVEAICEQNFDWRMCGVHGTAYGKGSYFAKDASYSDRYSSIKKSVNKIMFAALVLVGQYSRGSSRNVRPASKGDGKTLFDSCVDCESNPSIFVVFEKQQVYPEYLINYS